MVQVQLNIEVDEKMCKLKMTLNLLKREDANEYEWQIAQRMEDAFKQFIMEAAKKTGFDVVNYREIKEEKNKTA